MEAGGQSYRASRLVACAGLQSDRIARLAGLEIDFQIVPFRGEYFDLAPHLTDLVHHLIYPIPDPDLPFLGVHLTPTIGGGVTVGPNAVLGFAREGYPKWSFARADVAEYARFAGMRKVARANLRTGARELLNSVFTRGYLRECRKYCPELSVGDLVPAPAGIRAQAVRRDGTLVHGPNACCTSVTRPRRQPPRPCRSARRSWRNSPASRRSRAARTNTDLGSDNL